LMRLFLLSPEFVQLFKGKISMGAVRRQTPRAMPSEASVESIAERVQTRFLMSGCRGDTARKNPAYEIHANFPLRGGHLSDLTERKVVIFVHGYNITTSEGLQHTESFYSRLEASLLRDGRPLNEYGGN